MVYTCCTPGAEKERIFAEAAAAGAEFIRVDVELDAIFVGSEAPDWTRLDEVIRLSRRHDVRLLGMVWRVPPSLSTCPDREEDIPLCAPRDPAEFGRLAAEVADHARGAIRHWEILNEPDARWAFKGGPEDYARMLAAAHDAIERRVPEAQIVFGGVERPRSQAWLERVFATPGVEVARKFDIAAVHLRVRLRNELPELAEWLRGWRERLADYGFRGPLWVTEHGYPADPAFQWDPAYRGGDTAQAAFLRESLPLLAEAGATQVFVTLRDNLFGEFLSEGIVHIDATPPDYPATRRPAFATVRGLVREWSTVMDARAERRRHEELGLQLARLARASAAAGRGLAAAVQGGAARGHALVAERLAERLEHGP